MKQAYLNRKPISPLKVMFSPFFAYDEIKYNAKGAVWQIPFLLLLLFFARVSNSVLSGFLFNANKIEDINVLYELMIIIIVYFAFVVSNWAFCALTDGEGSFIEIAAVSAFATLPYTAGCFITTFLTNVFVLDEASFLGIVNLIFVLWSVIILIIGLKTAHQFAMKMNLFSLLITVAFMLLIAFLAVIVFSIAQQFLIFINNIYNEIIFML